MRISEWVPKELQIRYRRTLELWLETYSDFNPQNPLHQMFAVQVMLMNESAAKYKNLPEDW